MVKVKNRFLLLQQKRKSVLKTDFMTSELWGRMIMIMRERERERERERVR